MTGRIPEARKRLATLTRMLYAAMVEIDALQKLMVRRKAKQLRPRVKRPITVKMKREMRRLSKNGKLTEAQIAIAVGLPPHASGRVSEVLHGDR
jgi:hypothetical protein